MKHDSARNSNRKLGARPHDIDRRAVLRVLDEAKQHLAVGDLSAVAELFGGCSFYIHQLDEWDDLDALEAAGRPIEEDAA
jgi:hypothetical protein